MTLSHPRSPRRRESSRAKTSTPPMRCGWTPNTLSTRIASGRDGGARTHGKYTHQIDQRLARFLQLRQHRSRRLLRDEHVVGPREHGLQAIVEEIADVRDRVYDELLVTSVDLTELNVRVIDAHLS